MYFRFKLLGARRKLMGAARKQAQQRKAHQRNKVTFKVTNVFMKLKAQLCYCTSPSMKDSEGAPYTLKINKEIKIVIQLLVNGKGQIIKKTIRGLNF